MKSPTRFTYGLPVSVCLSQELTYLWIYTGYTTPTQFIDCMTIIIAPTEGGQSKLHKQMSLLH